MSDEQQPPALRLKPRLKPAEGEAVPAAPAAATPPPAAPARVETAPPADGEAKVRLKPRLTPAAEPAAAPPAPTPAAEAPAAAPPKIQLKPKISLTPPASAATPAPETPPPTPAETPAPTAPAAEAPKFKFKPKAPETAAPAAGAPAATPPPPAAGGPPKLPPPPGVKPQTVPPMPPPPPAAGAPKPPPFPVVAPPKTGKTTPPIPHISAPTEPPMPVPEGAAAAVKKIPIWKNRKIQIAAAAAILVLGAGGFILLRPAPPPPPKPVVKPATAATPAAKAPNPAIADKPATPALSDTQNAIAHAPVNAINKAKDVAGKRVGGDQGRDAVAAITDENAPVNAAQKSAPKAPAPTVAASSKIADGISATNDAVAAAAEASPAFRSFVANAKISGVFQGEPPRIILNGRLVRGGESVDSGLGINFDNVDEAKKILIFKDKSGATVTRRY